MKRSKKIVLTLLVPAMAAFGCSRETPPDVGGGSFAETSALEQTADLNGDGKISDEERKEASGNGSVAHNAPTTVHRSRGFMPIPIPIPMGGNRGRVAPVAPPRVNPSRQGTASREEDLVEPVRICLERHNAPRQCSPTAELA